MVAFRTQWSSTDCNAGQLPESRLSGIRRIALAVLICSLAACAGDSTPLPPLVIGPQCMPLMLDTTGNLVMRRLGMWVDTAHVTMAVSGFAVASQLMQIDMQIGGMSTGMQTRTEIDCAGKRYRVVGLDSMTASIKGVPVADSIAKQVNAAQRASVVGDTAWQSASDYWWHECGHAVCRLREGRSRAAEGMNHGWARYCAARHGCANRAGCADRRVGTLRGERRHASTTCFSTSSTTRSITAARAMSTCVHSVSSRRQSGTGTDLQLTPRAAATR